MNILSPLFEPSDKCLKAHRWGLIYGSLLLVLPFLDLQKTSAGIISFTFPKENEWIVWVIVIVLYIYNTFMFYMVYYVEALQYKEEDLKSTGAQLLVTPPNIPLEQNSIEKAINDAINANLQKSHDALITAGWVRSVLIFCSPIILASVILWVWVGDDVKQLFVC